MCKTIYILIAIIGLSSSLIPVTSLSVAKTSESSSLRSIEGKIATKININTAEVKTLATLKGIGPKKAQSIVDYRKEHGHFKSIDDITAIPGINKKLFDKIKPYITTD